MATTRVHYPCFFQLRTEQDRKLHAGWPVLAPELIAANLGAESAAHALSRRVHDAAEGEAGTLVARLATIPADAEDGHIRLEVPWQRRRTTITTPFLHFVLGAHPVVCLPRLRNSVFVLPAGTPRADYGEALQSQVNTWFRALDPDDTSDDGDEEWAEKRGDRFVWLRTTVKVDRTSFATPDIASFLQALSGQAPMSGADELRKVAADLTRLYPDGLRLDLVPDPRVAEVQRLLFEDPHPAPTVLIGPSGAGKTTLLHAAIRRHMDARARLAHPPALRRVFHLDPNRIVAGMSVIGAWERRMTAILEHLVDGPAHVGRGALYVDNPVALSLVGRSAGSALNLCSLLRPWLAARRVPFVLEATPEEWNRLEEADRAFTELFTIARVDAPVRPAAFRMALANLERVERSHNCRFPLETLRRVVDLEARHPGPRVAPGNLVDRLTVLASRHAGGEVTPAHADATYAGATGLNPALFDPTRPLLDADLKSRLGARLIGQADAVNALADVVHVLRAGLARPRKPLAAWLLVGPTGVGKTEAAKVLAELLYPGRPRLLRFDMNEMVDAGAVSRPLGDAEQEGQLTGRVRQDPYAVVLLDEIEKAHPSVHDLLLQLLDEGHLTDARGRRADFQRAVVILTSNVGSGKRLTGQGFGGAVGSLNTSYRMAVEQAFRPELVNRLDRIVVFRPLELPDIRRIATLQVQRVLLREGFLRRTVLLDVADAALDRLAAVGFDPELGARALKRTIEQDVVGRMAGLLATLPVEQPVLIRMRASSATGAATGVATGAATGGGVEAAATPLTLATRQPGRALPEDLTADALNLLLDRLPATAFRATASRDGVAIEGREIHELRERLQDALRELTPDRPGVELPDTILYRVHRAASRARWLRQERRWEGGTSFRSARDYLLDGEPATEWAGPDHHDVPLDPVHLAILSEKLALQTAGVRETVRLRIRMVTPGPGRPWVAPYLARLAQVVDQLWPDAERWVRRGTAPEADGWEPDPTGSRSPECPRLWRVHGPMVTTLLEGEVGMHVWYPIDAPPLAVAVELLPDGPIGDTPVGTEPPIVRLYMPEVHEDTFRAEDLRSGEVVEEPGVEAPPVPFLRWWWMRRDAGAAQRDERG